MPTTTLDATPLSAAHGLRGIGAVVQGLIEGFAGLADRPELLVRRGQPVPAPFTGRPVRWPAWPYYRVPDPFPPLIERALGRNGVFHATQPSLVPRRGRVVATCYDLIPARFPRWYLSGPGRWPERAAYRRYLGRLRAAQLVWAISEQSGHDAVRLAGVDPGRVRVVPLAAPAQRAPEGPVPSGDYVLVAGGLEPHKNAAAALEALAGVGGDVRLVMAGPWSTRRAERLQRRAGALGVADRVVWLGWVGAGRLAALRGGAAAVLVPSWAEGFGLPVVEGMAAGVPVLAADIPALRESGGDAAVYLPPGRPERWSAAIERLLDDPDERARRAEAGRRRADTFTWERTARGVADLYAEAAA